MVAAVGRGERVVDLDLPGLDKFAKLPARRKQNATPFLTVQEGCDKFCTYCVVPYTRGAEISRGWAELVDEAKALVDAGAKEITLARPECERVERRRAATLGTLIRALDKIDGLRRIRYMTSHPNDMTDGLIAAHGDVEKLMPFLHLPVQSGSDRILKAMNRSHSRDSYLRILDRVRAVRPDIAFSGDFIVGFPGESDADFEDTLSLVREVRHAQAYSFKYSPRPGTPAADMADQIAPKSWTNGCNASGTNGRRPDRFQPRRLAKPPKCCSKDPESSSGQLIGKSPWLQSVHVLAPGLSIGDIVDRRYYRFWTPESQRRIFDESSRLNGQKGTSASWRYVATRNEL